MKFTQRTWVIWPALSIGLLAGLLASAAEPAPAREWNPHDHMLAALVKKVPSTLKSQDPATGRFGTQPWICTDQNVMIYLAAAWSIQDQANPFYHDPKVLEAIMKGGDALVADQDRNGAWTFRKKDNSTWGQILMPWTYSRWIRTFAIIKDAMPAERRQNWEKGLLLGFKGISKSCLREVHNIATHHAMALYCAGQCFGREDWQQQAQAFLAKVVAAQAPGGWWSEHSGPVVGYNAVYVEALGLYYTMSHDPAVLDCLRRAAIFHATFTYPDGSRVETVDERNPYEPGVERGNVGLSLTPEGRGYLLQQYELSKWSAKADEAAEFLLCGVTGPTTPTMAGRDEALTFIGNQEALVLRRKPWFICISAFVCEPSSSRWIQDRQNFVSVFHDQAGLIIGGGNTKVQPFWSTFTAGDTSLLRHKPGDTSPSFGPKSGLIHLPKTAHLIPHREAPGIQLAYGADQCQITVQPRGENALALVCEATSKSSKPVEAHLTFIPRLKETLTTAGGKSSKLSEQPFEWKEADLGAWFELGKVRVTVPNGSKLLWPARRHNPYKKDGSSTLQEARLVLCLPFSASVAKQEVTLEVKK